MIECSICKANNEDRSLFCLECGQRLKPKALDPQSSSSKLHSPMLDLGGQSQGRKNKSNNAQFNVSENAQNGSSNGSPMGISRNGLHSPLLDGRNYFANSYAEQTPDSPADISADSNYRNGDKSRLHSPVLDGPVSTKNVLSRSRNNFAVEEQEYESLRSPLLETRVPLPEIHTGNHLENAHIESGQTIQSVLGNAASPVIKNQPERFNKAGAEPKTEDILSFSKRQPLNVSQSLLPADAENSKVQSRPFDQNKSTLNKSVIMPLIFLALGFKIWFLLSLGNTLFVSAPFAFDQAGQILAILSISIIAFSVKN